MLTTALGALACVSNISVGEKWLDKAARLSPRGEGWQSSLRAILPDGDGRDRSGTEKRRGQEGGHFFPRAGLGALAIPKCERQSASEPRAT